MLSFFIVFAIIQIAESFDTDVISPTVVNASGEYYITDQDHQFKSKTIKCNSTLNDNCFIICNNFNACSMLQIECSSKTCNINCYEESSCNGIEVIFSQQNISTIDTNFTINCNGVYACFGGRIIHSTTSDNINVNLSMICHDDRACYGLYIYLLENDILHLICNESIFDSGGTCILSNITISPLTNHTKITCSGNAESADCTTMYINVPPIYEPDFIIFEFLNGPYDESANNIWLQCIGGPCNTSTGYPLLSIAKPSIVNETGIYYLTGSANMYSIQYSYRWQSIICNNSSQKCFIQCENEESCKFSFIQCNNCDISCNGHYSCSNSIINLYGNNANIVCYGWISCGFTSITASINTSLSLTCYGDIYNTSENTNIYNNACKGTQIYCNSFNKDSCNIQSMLYDPSPLLGIHIPSQFENGFFNLSYQGEQKIYKVQIYCDQGDNVLIWNATNVHHQQLQHIGPCNLWKPTFLCDDDNECMIDCAQNITNINPYYSSPIGCSGMNINGVTTNNLNIICPDYGCFYTMIYCSDKLCNIQCNGIQSCVYTDIQAINSKLISIVAETQINEKNSAAIYKSSIYANFTNKLFMACKDGYCLNNRIYANYAENVSIQCANNRNSTNIYQTGCNDMSFYFENASDIQFVCDGQWSCIDGAIFAKDSHLLNISISNTNSNNNTYVLPLIYGSNDTLLACKNYGCQYLDLYLVDGLSDINVTWDGNCSCNSLDFCVNNGWDIHCGTNYNNYSVFSHNSCTNNGICCSNISINDIQHSFADYWNRVCKYNEDKHKLIKIISVMLAIMVIIVIGIGLFIRRYRQKRKAKEEEKYLQINS